ncbi:MAG: type II toxin-antitoxin system Phd/YefM family antitoxin [Desulfuromusa sp.]|jgi:prevent-host-death family protein|nr:type II toxin-antitoxin system Phd/YefM family antitoxin [Desulfuromusa sp.]
MTQHNIAEAKAHFSEIIQKALLGEEVIIAKGNKPLVKIVPLKNSDQKRIPGTGSGQLLYMADDFDETPEDFKDYM